MNKEYKEHIAFLNSLPDINNATDEDYLVAFKRLLKLIPNNGKLYKYKDGNGRNFENTYQSLKNDYIWIPNINGFNDKFDCSINYDYERDKINLLNYLDNNKHLVFKYFLRREKEYPETRYFTLGDRHADYVLIGANYLNNKGEIDTFGLSMYLRTHFSKHSKQLVSDVKKLTLEAFNIMLKKYDNYKKELAESIGEINNSRESIHVFCLCEKYNLNSMWAHYCKNFGLVIEYDFNKLLNQDITYIKKCISLYRVQYHNKPILELFDLFKLLFNGEENISSKNVDILDQLTTKDRSWSFEKEWRLILLDINNKLPLDIVSSIYIDYDLFITKKCKKLLSLAKKRHWKVFVRKQNNIKTKYIYDRYN